MFCVLSQTVKFLKVLGEDKFDYTIVRITRCNIKVLKSYNKSKVPSEGL